MTKWYILFLLLLMPLTFAEAGIVIGDSTIDTHGVVIQHPLNITATGGGNVTYNYYNSTFINGTTYYNTTVIFNNTEVLNNTILNNTIFNNTIFNNTIYNNTNVYIYNESLVNETILITGQVFNETSLITTINGWINAVVSNLTYEISGRIGNDTQIRIDVNRINNTQIADNITVTTLANTKAFPGACPDGEVVNETTTTGVICVPRLNPSTTYYPQELQIEGGTNTTGLLNLTWYYDDKTYNITEGNGVNPLTFYINYTNVTTFSQWITREYYIGSPNHNIIFEIYKYTDSTWQSYYGIVGQSGQTIISIPVLDPSEHIQNGIVQTRYRHIENGKSSHKLYIDFAWLIDGNNIGASTNLEGYARYTFGDNNFTGTGNITANSFFGYLNWSWIQNVPGYAFLTDLSAITTNLSNEQTARIGNDTEIRDDINRINNTQIADNITVTNTFTGWINAIATNISTIWTHVDALNTTIETKLNITDQRYNDTAAIEALTRETNIAMRNESNNFNNNSLEGIGSVQVHNSYWINYSSNACIYWNGTSIIINNNATGFTCK